MNLTRGQSGLSQASQVPQLSSHQLSRIRFTLWVRDGVWGSSGEVFLPCAQPHLGITERGTGA